MALPQHAIDPMWTRKELARRSSAGIDRQGVGIGPMAAAPANFPFARSRWRTRRRECGTWRNRAVAFNIYLKCKRGDTSANIVFREEAR